MKSIVVCLFMALLLGMLANESTSVPKIKFSRSDDEMNDEPNAGRDIGEQDNEGTNPFDSATQFESPIGPSEEGVDYEPDEDSEGEQDSPSENSFLDQSMQPSQESEESQEKEEKKKKEYVKYSPPPGVGYGVTTKVESENVTKQKGGAPNQRPQYSSQYRQLLPPTPSYMSVFIRFGDI